MWVVEQIHKMHGGKLCNRPRIEPRSAKNSHFSHFETGELKNGIVLEQYIFDGDDMRWDMENHIPYESLWKDA